jgi:hypothetical protein
MITIIIHCIYTDFNKSFPEICLQVDAGLIRQYEYLLKTGKGITPIDEAWTSFAVREMANKKLKVLRSFTN